MIPCSTNCCILHSPNRDSRTNATRRTPAISRSLFTLLALILLSSLSEGAPLLRDDNKSTTTMKISTRQASPSNTRSLCDYHNSQDSLSCSFHDTCIESTFQCGTKGFSLYYGQPRCNAVRLIRQSTDDCQYCLRNQKLVDWVLKTEQCVQPKLLELAKSHNRTVVDQLDCLKFEKDAFQSLQYCYKEENLLNDVLTDPIDPNTLADLHKIIQLFSINDYYRPYVAKLFHELIEEYTSNATVINAFAPSYPFRVFFCAVATRTNGILQTTDAINAMKSVLGGTYTLASDHNALDCASSSPPAANVALKEDFKLIQWIPDDENTEPQLNSDYYTTGGLPIGGQLVFFQYKETITDSVCGNGVREAGEMCDMFGDNDIEGRDTEYGCSESCSINPGYDCTIEQLERSECFKTRCGDGLRTSDEECDDNNTVSNDGCSSSCKIERNYKCSTKYNSTSVCQLKPVTSSIEMTSSSISPSSTSVAMMSSSITTVLPTRTSTIEPTTLVVASSGSTLYRLQCWSLLLPLLIIFIFLR